MHYDVFGLGNALVDVVYHDVTQLFLKEHDIDKGVMTLLDHNRFNLLLDALGSKPSIQSGGGSAANSMIALAQLGGSAFYACRVGDDPAGHFYRKDLLESGVATSVIDQGRIGETGRCLVMVTPDADRTLNTYLGITSEFSLSDVPESELKKARYIYLEGYLLAQKGGVVAVGNACQLAGEAKNLDELKQALEKFDGCPLKKTATNLVFGDGAEDAKVVFIGEGPGAEEDR
ncbi:MAG: adenosine kinase, partial [Bdellovibrionales bacterium]|nr:adenosine kinase [Bdellovibrionales bacterium]